MKKNIYHILILLVTVIFFSCSNSEKFSIEKGKVGPGRDHNKGGFSIWMAGAGLRPGMAHGVTDEIGWKATESPTNWHDFHATVMHLLGMNHEELTFYHNGIERRLTNVHGNIISEVLA